MLISKLWQSIMVFCAVFISCIFFFVAGNLKYGVEMDDEFNETYYEIEKTMNETGALGESLATKAEAGKESQTNPWLLMPKAALAIIKSPFTAIKITIKVINLLANKFLIPQWFIWFLITFITGSIAFIVIAAATGRKL